MGLEFVDERAERVRVCRPIVKYLENLFWELLPKLHFSTGMAEFKKKPLKTKKMPTIFNSAEIWFSWGVNICNES